ncbi:RNA-binding domain-containing protein [Bacillus sp. AK031]
MYYEHIVPVNLKIFLQSPSHVNLKNLFLTNTGETDYLDFKAKWTNWTKMAKHILAIANTGGGAIIIGVGQLDDGSINLRGLTEEEYMDKADIDNKLQHMLPKYLKYRTEDFLFTEESEPSLHSKLFQVLMIEYDPKYIPYTSIAAGGDLRYNAIYLRQGTKSVEATHDKLLEIILRKVHAGNTDNREMTLKEHLEQLQTLFIVKKKAQDLSYRHYLEGLILKKQEKVEMLMGVHIKKD